MTLLVGQDGSGWGAPINIAINGGSGFSNWKASGYTSVAAGTVTDAKIYIADWVAASTGRVYVYSAADALLATSAEFNSGMGTGLLTAALSLSIAASTSYKLVFRPDTSYPEMRVRDNSSPYETQQYAMAAGYPTGDATLDAGTSNAYPEFIIWLDGTAGGGATLTVDKGDLVLAGQDVTLTATAGVTLTVDKGDLVLTGQDITLVAENDVTLTVDNGSLTLTGQDIPFIYESTASTGQLTLTGQDVTLTLSADVTLTVDNGDLVLTGQDIPFIYESTAATGQLVLTGQDVTLTASSTAVMPVDAGSLQLTGQDVTLIAVNNVRITVDASALTLTGSDVTLLADADITLPVDFVVLQLTGSNVGLTATVSSVDITGPSNLTFVSYSKEFPYETYRVKLRWTEGRRSATSFVSHYKLYKNGTYTGVQIPHSGTSTTIDYLESGLAKGTYTFRVSAVDNQGNETDQSNQITVTIMTMQDRGWLGGQRWKNLRRF